MNQPCNNRQQQAYTLLNYCIAAVWIANGLFCKMLNLVPRHEKIVSVILGTAHARLFTFSIGLLETGMAIWILSGFKSRFNTITQISIVATMNLLECMLVPDLLLWGKLNAVFAFLFILVLYFNEFYMNPKSIPQT